MSQIIRPFTKQGNFTVVNNFIIDHIMPTVSPNAFKVLMFAIRKTVGWHKESDRISYSQFMEGCGIGGRSTVSKAIKELIALNYLHRHKVGCHKRTKKPLYAYSLNAEYEVAVNSPETGLLAQSNSPKTEPLNSPKTEPLNSPKTGLTKDTKETKQSDGDDNDTVQLELSPVYNVGVTNKLMDVGVNPDKARELSVNLDLPTTEKIIAYARDHAHSNIAGYVLKLIENGFQPVDNQVTQQQTFDIPEKPTLPKARPEHVLAWEKLLSYLQQVLMNGQFQQIASARPNWPW